MMIEYALLQSLCCAAGLGDSRKLGPDEAFALLQKGIERFVAGAARHPHADRARLALAGRASQADHAYATMLTCSDSRVPVELIFDAGVMDLFVIRVAGNVCNTDEIGSIEFGLAHVRTPVMVLLGHTQCGAVTTVTQQMLGKGHPLERNIPPLVGSIEAAVKQAMAQQPGIQGEAIIPYAIEENIWLGIERIFLASPAVRGLVKRGTAKVLGAIYDVGTGVVTWLPERKTQEILLRVESNPDRAEGAMA